MSTFGHGTPKQEVYEAAEYAKEEHGLDNMDLLIILSEITAYIANDVKYDLEEER